MPRDYYIEGNNALNGDYVVRSYSIIFLIFALIINVTVYAQTVTMQGNERTDYFVEILKQALSYSPDKNYQISFYNQDIPKSRVFENIIDQNGIDIVAAGATTNREKILQPIWFPTLKGLFGWRMPLVNKDSPDLFLNILSADAFKQLTVGQLHSWSDTKILESNGLTVEKGSHFEGLFHMLEAKRFDYFPRSILEVQKEFDARKELAISVDTHALIHYPSAYIFYVSKNNQTLAQDVKYGLEQSLKDGSFERLFMRYFGDIIKQTHSEKRAVYQLNNPLLPKRIPIQRKELWLNFATQKEVIL